MRLAPDFNPYDAIPPMTFLIRFPLAAGLAIVLCLADVSAQSPSQRRDVRQIQQAQQQAQQQMRAAAENQPQLPSDPQLLSLHKEFVAKAEKLAMEYERKKEFDKAREVYESLVRLVPKYGSAEDGLGRILANQRIQDRRLTDIEANQQWQDTGVVLREGMPVHIEVKGTWKVVYETGPDGIEIPEKFRPRDNRIKLGTLIGVVVNSPAELTEERPFVVEQSMDFTAKKTGRLYMRMFDVDPSDNEGKMYVLIQSTFAQ